MARTMLVLGGTQFVGEAVVKAALARHWNVGVLNRGRGPSSDARIERFLGDRTRPGHLDAVTRRQWDAVVDTWSGHPSVVEDSAAALRGCTQRYVYVSSRSVYAWPAPHGADETAPLVPAGPPSCELDYARSKRMAEDAVLRAFAHDHFIARAGLLLGPRETPCRLPWWLARIARGGDVPVPGPPSVDVQYLDVRDLADWIMVSLERGTTGIFNAVGPIGGATIGEIVALCREATKSNAAIRWVDPGIVEREGIEPWTSLPLWLRPGPDHAALHRGDVSAAHLAGLVERPLRETVFDTWNWTNSDAGKALLARARVGLTPDEERRLLSGARTGP